MVKLLPHHIRRTLAINPENYSAQTSRDRRASFIYAIAGILHMLRYAKNVRIQLIATILVGACALWLDLGRIEGSILVLVIGLNWFAEFINAAIEATVNIRTSEPHPMAQVAKDVAAGAVLLIAMASIIIGGLLLGYPFWERIS